MVPSRGLEREKTDPKRKKKKGISGYRLRVSTGKGKRRGGGARIDCARVTIKGSTFGHNRTFCLHSLVFRITIIKSWLGVWSGNDYYQQSNLGATVLP